MRRPSVDNRSSAVFTPDRRRHSRFDIISAECTLVAMAEMADCEQCGLLNASYAGVRFRASRRLEQGAIREFRIELAPPIGFSVRVKARICWVRPSESDGYVVGAQFLQSSRGWLAAPSQS